MKTLLILTIISVGKFSDNHSVENKVMYFDNKPTCNFALEFMQGRKVVNNQHWNDVAQERGGVIIYTKGVCVNEGDL